MATQEITVESFKINIWYKAATYLGILLILITAENPSVSIGYYHLGTFSLALGAIFLTVGYLIDVYSGWLVEDHSRYGRFGSYERSQVVDRMAPIVTIYEVCVVIGLIIWVIALLAWTL